MTGSVLESDLIDGVTTAPYVCEGGFCGAVTPSAYTQSKPTWRISLDQKFSTDIMGYVSYNRGFKSGGFNAQQPLPANPYRSEKVDAFELGDRKSVGEGKSVSGRVDLGGSVMLKKNHNKHIKNKSTRIQIST